MAQSARDPMDEVARLLALQVRLQVGNQETAIVEMNKIGIGPSRIATLLGTTTGTVNQAIIRSKRRKPTRRK